MSATLIDTLPSFRIDFNLQKALSDYTKNRKSFAEGALCRGAFNRTTQIGFEATLAGNGVHSFGNDGRVTYIMPVTLGKKEMKAMHALGARMVEEATRQTVNDKDKWEYKSPVKTDGVWNVKIKVDRNEDFIPEINGGEVNQTTFSNFGHPGEKVEIVGVFGIWMNPERGQYGIKFDAQRIDF